MKNNSLTVLILAMIVSFTTMAFTYPKKADPPTNKTNSNLVTYVVNIDDTYSHGFCGEYYVVVTLPCGNPVAPPQLYQEGKDNYIFEEAGSNSGMRYAKLIRVYGQSTVNCTHQVYAQPDYENITFACNSLCMFYLFPVLVSGND